MAGIWLPGFAIAWLALGLLAAGVIFARFQDSSHGFERDYIVGDWLAALTIGVMLGPIALVMALLWVGGVPSAWRLR